MVLVLQTLEIVEIDTLVVVEVVELILLTHHQMDKVLKLIVTGKHFLHL